MYPSSTRGSYRGWRLSSRILWISTRWSSSGPSLPKISFRAGSSCVACAKVLVNVWRTDELVWISSTNLCNLAIRSYVFISVFIIVDGKENCTVDASFFHAAQRQLLVGSSCLVGRQRCSTASVAMCVDHQSFPFLRWSVQASGGGPC